MWLLFLLEVELDCVALAGRTDGPIEHLLGLNASAKSGIGTNGCCPFITRRMSPAWFTKPCS